MSESIRIASRQSPLAQAQARHVASQLERLGHRCTFVWMQSLADHHLDKPIHDLGGKGVFVGALEQALLAGDADIAVHSVKDMPSALEPAFIMPAILPRASVQDVWVGCETFHPKPGQRWGTGSLRRRVQLEQAYPGIECVPIRGNVQTRLAKISTTNIDGVVLAEAGLARLGLDVPVHRFATDTCLPAAGQGAIGVECLAKRVDLHTALHPLNHRESADCVMLERAINHKLGGHCMAPLATYVHHRTGRVHLHARLIDPHTGRRLEALERVSHEQAAQAVDTIVGALNAQGAQAILTSTA